MQKKLFSSKIFILIIVLAVCGLLIFLSPQWLVRPLKIVAHVIISPFQKIAYLMTVKIVNGKDFIFSIGKMKQENEKLLQENQVLISENAKLSDFRRRNEILEEQLNMLPKDKYEMESAYVIGADPNGFGSWIEISKGGRKGIEVGMPAIISNNILIGKVESVEPETSRILLITGPTSKVNALSVETGAKGLVSGKFGLGIVFERILQTDEIREGNSIVTSGLAKEIPRGIYVGRIQNVALSEDKLFYQGIIISPVDFSKLEIISIIKRVK